MNICAFMPWGESGLVAGLLILVIIAVVILARMVQDLKAEVAELRRAHEKQPPPLPAAPPAAAAAPVSQPPPVPVESSEVSSDVFAAVVAAVHFTLGGNYRVVSVMPQESMAWSREGRRHIFGSHAPR